MKTYLFESFSSKLADVPPNGIPRAIELEHWLLENDLLYKCNFEVEEVSSVLSFCRFVRAVLNGADIFPVELPARHFLFYRAIVMRLIEAFELPVSAKERFDQVFSPELLRVAA